MSKQDKKANRYSKQIREENRQDNFQKNRKIQQARIIFYQLVENLESTDIQKQIQASQLLCDYFLNQIPEIALPQDFLLLLIPILDVKADKNLYINILRIIKYLIQDYTEIREQIIIKYLDYFKREISYFFENVLICDHLLQLISMLINKSQIQRNQSLLSLTESFLTVFLKQNNSQLKVVSIYCLIDLNKINTQQIQKIILQNSIVEQCCQQILCRKQQTSFRDKKYVYHVLQFMQACSNKYQPKNFQKYVLPFILQLNQINFDIGYPNVTFQPYKLQKKSLKIIQSSIQSKDKLSIFMEHQLGRILLRRLKDIDPNESDNKQTFDLLRKIFWYLQQKSGVIDNQLNETIRIKGKIFFCEQQDDQMTNQNDIAMVAEI